MYIRLDDFDVKYLTRPMDEDASLSLRVSEILSAVRECGDDAVKEYARVFDGSDLESLYATEEEFEEASKLVSPELKRALGEAKENITRFHSAQMIDEGKVEVTEGVVCWRKNVPINKVGLYVPGGSAPHFSTVLMLAIPASIAGCREIILATPAKGGKVAHEILYAAKISGVTKVLKAGGAHAIAALAYGTRSVPKCDKIFGPGNRFVTEAKKLVSTTCAIDMLAGPSEVLVAIDSTSDVSFAAADLLSQAEHGKDSQVILLIMAEDKRKAEAIHAEVESAIEEELGRIGRHEYILPSLSHSHAFFVSSEEEMAHIINEYAPEHLIISTKDPETVLEKVENAGSVFLGRYTPESAGDYASGTNHTLPTSGWARSSAGVSLDSFIKKMTVQKITKAGLESLSDTITTMARKEGLDAHAYAVSVRVGK